jgi:dihydroneopterin aldolase
MKSYILLNSVEFYAYHGVMPQETKVGNRFTADIRLKVGVEKAACSDELSDTLNYAEIYRIMEKEMKIPSRLIEHVGGRIIRSLREAFPAIEGIELKISKMNPPIEGQVESASIVLIDGEL